MISYQSLLLSTIVLNDCGLWHSDHVTVINKTLKYSTNSMIKFVYPSSLLCRLQQVTGNLSVPYKCKAYKI